MLGTYFFTASALNAVGCFAMPVGGQCIVIIKIHIPVVKNLFGIQARKEIRNPDFLWTVVLLNAVMAGCAGNHICIVKNFHYFFQCLTLFGIQRLKVLELFRGLRMHEVKVEIIYPAPFQLVFKKWPDILLLLEIRAGQLIRQDIAVPWGNGRSAPL